MKERDKEYYSDDLKNSRWLGQVIDNADSEFEGRIKVRVFGKYDELEDEDIPWAHAKTNISASSISGGGFFSVPKIGSIVGITFDNGNIYYPEYHFNQHISDELKTEISEVPENYVNAHSLIYDMEIEGGLKVFYTIEKGLMFDYNLTQINIRTDNSIYITNPNGDIIELTNEGNMNVTLINDKTINIGNNFTKNIGNDSVINIVNDSNVTIGNDSNITVGNNCNIIATADIGVECANATLTATGTVEVEGSLIKLGTGAVQSVIKGELFQTWANSHFHVGNLGAPTSPAVTPSTPDHLSTKVKTE